MSRSNAEELLRPSLGDTRSRQAPYSQTMLFVASFFGGPVAAVLGCGLNAWRLGRVLADLPWLLTSLALYAWLEWWLVRVATGVNLSHAVAGVVGISGSRFLVRVLALAVFGLGCLAHRRDHRMAALTGMQAPKSGWWVGLLLVVIGIAATEGLRQLIP